LALSLVAFIACWLYARDDPDAEARQTFRRNLAVASSNWYSVKLECTSPGCANYVEAYWMEAGVKYVFSGFRHPKSMGAGGVVMVHEVDNYRDGTGPELVSCCFMSDGSPTKVRVGKGVKADIGWAEPLVREFFDAIPVNDWPG